MVTWECHQHPQTQYFGLNRLYPVVYFIVPILTLIMLVSPLYANSASCRTHRGLRDLRVSALDWQHSHGPDHTQDSDFNTRWSAKGDGQTIEYDLGGLVRMLNGVAIAWFKGDQRQASFAIEVSPDGQDWLEVYQGQSSGTTLGLELYSFNITPARYVRIIGHGNTSNNWNSLTEVRIYFALD